MGRKGQHRHRLLRNEQFGAQPECLQNCNIPGSYARGIFPVIVLWFGAGLGDSP